MIDKALTIGGVSVPRLGFGTWTLRGEQCASVVTEALRAGYRHVDTAQGYDNETAVGDGLRASGVSRSDVFITTKVRPQLISNGPLQKSVEESLKRLQVDRIDLLLIHWPNPAIAVRETITALSETKRSGLTRNIGASNFTVALLDEAVRASPEPLLTNQIELHPFLDQERILAATRRHKLVVTAYCPLALSRVAREPLLQEIGAAHTKTPAQVALRWLIQQGDVIAIPKASSAEHLRENLDVFDFELSSDEVRSIGALGRTNMRLINEPQWVPEWD